MRWRSGQWRLAILMMVAVGVGCQGGARDQVVGYLPQPFLPQKEKAVVAKPATVPQPKTSRQQDPLLAGLPSDIVLSGGLTRNWQYIVIHHSASPAGGAQSFHRAHLDRGWDELGYHFVIGNGTDTSDGAIEVGSRWKKQKHGAHCKTPDNFYNDYGIGICLVGNFEKSKPSAAQLESLRKLVRYLSATCKIPLAKIVTHGGVTRKTQCPGRNFSLGVLRRNLQDMGMVAK